MRALDRQAVAKNTEQLLRAAAIAAVVLLAAHIVPKGYAPRSTWRLLWTVACFASAGWLCYLATMPREQWLRDLYAWRF